MPAEAKITEQPSAKMFNCAVIRSHQEHFWQSGRIAAVRSGGIWLASSKYRPTRHAGADKTQWPRACLARHPTYRPVHHRPKGSVTTSRGQAAVEVLESRTP